jgi:hypothetical protein
MDPEGLVARVDAPELVDEVHVPEPAAELAVGGGLEADLLLHPDDVGDGLVLDRSPLLRSDAPGGSVLPCLEHLRGTQQAAHVIGSERWGGALRHVSLPSGLLSQRQSRVVLGE